jgi:hypothetical protein
MAIYYTKCQHKRCEQQAKEKMEQVNHVFNGGCVPLRGFTKIDCEIIEQYATR